ncbi:MAG: hypothetical protein ACLS4Z_01430 [Christensenellaceae bacterium]
MDKYADILVVQCLSLGFTGQTICRVLEKSFPRAGSRRSDAAVRKEGLPSRACFSARYPTK